ncbi:cytochrome bc complex cytochrome b subunit [Candidatus Poribacteria bacterium]|jgi:quinol-cytochrome oxidoreductase complex cytochrome b subunit|nr:cytochrome bc complex cytochrome b subunit [Candidatus Poribacteria bacterium]MBT5533892.1 cytochrome bc complex cytochrome b subunit [Candidatus Poribacteria bacterium]MBT5713939.1 cytochrome bc complex cytochrome b subunit [Candidatus Poribacteria bacterium]MBT7101266.1 cytochrome bc complex cytochrome b subunit [Candidatus Poribacteria bacterium]MBT7804599.1 cytochrome bc complex cytochrome b subunit [Candidatus Poribacteria bacterium]
MADQHPAVRWLRDAIPIDPEVLRDFSAEPIPNHLKRWWYALGGTPAYLFVVLAATGISLTFYYRPSPDHAYESVARITNEIRFGWFIRSVHHWAANLMVLAVLLHILRVFFTRAYRKPRELNWMFGVGILITLFTFGFSGYSLVYEQLSYWAAVVGTNIAEATPIVGPYMARFLRGGADISANTLTRMFVIHIGVLPTAIVMLLGFHFLQIRLHGVAIPDREFEADRGKTFPFFPNHLMTELVLGLTLTIILTVLALVAPATLGEPADPNVTPEHIKPEWYFFAMFRWLKLTSFEVGVLGAMAFVGIFLFWPFIDRLIERAFPGKGVAMWIGVVGVLTLIVFTIWEAFV